MIQFSRALVISFFLILAFSNVVFAQLTLIVEIGIKETPSNQNIFLAGSINNWNPNDTTFKLINNNDGTYQLTFTPPQGHIEYKFTKGSWGTVETSEEGQDIPNRTLQYDGTPQTVNLTIEGWKKENTTPTNITSTAAKNVSILKEKFFIPQLDRERKIWVYLPPDYETTNKTYPVLYMHDGQNLFDVSTSFAGEWNVDESLNELFENRVASIIVVGIENGEATRTNEYTPWTNPKYGGGDGEKYVKFIVETLKPYVDDNFRTKTDRANTGIMGSSLGGLISFYAAIKHQDVFSKAGVFSPSFWFSDEIYDMVDRIGKVFDMKIYLLGGELESEDLVDEINAMVTTLKYAGFEDSEIKMVTHKDGKHNEQYWSREYKDCYLWLFR